MNPSQNNKSEPLNMFQSEAPSRLSQPSMLPINTEGGGEINLSTLTETPPRPPINSGDGRQTNPSLNNESNPLNMFQSEAPSRLSQPSMLPINSEGGGEIDLSTLTETPPRPPINSGDGRQTNPSLNNESNPLNMFQSEAPSRLSQPSMLPINSEGGGEIDLSTLTKTPPRPPINSGDGRQTNPSLNNESNPLNMFQSEAPSRLSQPSMLPINSEGGGEIDLSTLTETPPINSGDGGQTNSSVLTATPPRPPTNSGRGGQTNSSSLAATPPRPPVNSGGGGQTNSTPPRPKPEPGQGGQTNK